MAEQTNISWCDSTINFWIGCTKVLDHILKLTDSGCKFCYADEQDERRFSRTLGGATRENPIRHWGKGAPRYKVTSAVKDALRYNKLPLICDDCGAARPIGNAKGEVHDACSCGSKNFHRRRIFSLSLGDWLDDEVPIDWLAEMLDTIRQCDQVTWILCTKRPENFERRIKSVMAFDMARKGQPSGQNTGIEIMDEYHPLYWWLDGWLGKSGVSKVPKHITLLVSVENQPAADKRIPELLKIPAACHGLSMEPLLGPVTLPETPIEYGLDRMWPKKQRIKWIIIGGESGANARPCNVDWIRKLVQQGKDAGVATFVKQIGARPISDYKVSRDHWLDTVADKKGGDPAEWPADLRVQEWPSETLQLNQTTKNRKTKNETTPRASSS